MIFQRYYAWIPQKTRSDGKAFREFIDRKMPDQKEYAAAEFVKKVDERGPKIVPLADFRYKKSRLKTG